MDKMINPATAATVLAWRSALRLFDTGALSNKRHTKGRQGRRPPPYLVAVGLRARQLHLYESALV